jgi:hypothetical protein
MKNYLLNFASANSTLVSGLAPTFVLFARTDTGATFVGPTITEAVSGWGLYTFQWGATTPIVFLCDGATSGLGSFRYIKGSLDPADRADEYGNTLVAIGNTLIFNTPANMGGTLTAIGNTLTAIGNSTYAAELAQGSTMQAIGSTLNAIGISNIALGTSIYASVGPSLIGTTSSLIGDSATDPTTLFGYLKRALEVQEGQQQFLKASGSWTMLDRTGATTLRTRTIANSASTVIRS